MLRESGKGEMQSPRETQNNEFEVASLRRKKNGYNEGKKDKSFHEMNRMDGELLA